MLGDDERFSQARLAALSSTANVPEVCASMPLSCGMSDVTRRRGEDEEEGEHALTVIIKATVDPRMISLEHRVFMVRTILAS